MIQRVVLRVDDVWNVGQFRRDQHFSSRNSAPISARIVTRSQ
jgi:hypothetical protein